MIILPPQHPKACIYCGTLVKEPKKGRGEHIIPEAIGGTLTLNQVSENRVCERCNNGVLSVIDNELCRRSHLSVIASQEIDAHLWQVWDVDHSAGNLLVEARPRWQDRLLASLVCYPQITFERDGPKIRGDMEDMQSIGSENFDHVLIKAAKGAFQRFCRDEKNGLYFEQIHTQIATEGYRYPPRAFTKHPIRTIARAIDKHPFTIRYLTERDKRFALHGFSTLGGKAFNRRSQVMGSRMPAMSVYFDPGVTLRALMKIGVNLLAAYCKKTPISTETFPKVIRLIRGDIHPTPVDVASNGFVRADGLEDIKGPPGTHTFRLVFVDGEWFVYSSFFGGRIGAFVHFPGPNKEDWNSAEIAAPIGSKAWPFKESRLITPMRVRIEWTDSAKICPSLEIQNSKSVLISELVNVKAKKKKVVH
jgi:hypothetical protein